MRFRTVEDERVYLALRTEFYLRLASHLPPAVMHEVLRNYGKIEALLYGEGIRQGMAVAAICGLNEVRGPVGGPNDPLMQRAIVAHADFYGDADTPLVRVEKANAERLLYPEPAPTGETLPWIDAAPVEFPPMTIDEAKKTYGDDLSVSGAPRGRRLEGADEFQRMVDRDIETHLDDAVQRELGRMDVDLPDPAVADHLETKDAAPDFLDRVRSELQRMMAQGWKPSGWEDLIMRLHQEMQIDAFFLDIQLSSDVGRAVLAQVGLSKIAPSLVGVDAAGGVRFAATIEELMKGRRP